MSTIVKNKLFRLIDLDITILLNMMRRIEKKKYVKGKGDS